MKVGDKKTLAVTTKPKAAAKTISYHSSKPSVVSVSKKGKLTAKKAGTAKVTITAASKKYKKKTVYVRIKVSEKTERTGNKTVDTDGTVTVGTKTYEGFVLDNVLSDGDENIHFNLYTPKSYDGSRAYALFVTLPGWEGLYFQGVGTNLRYEKFGQESIHYNDRMIVVAPQLDDWGETSARQTITLVEYFLSAYNIDKSKVYIDGLSGGGETLSLVLEKRPELFTAALHIASQWDGKDYRKLIKSRTPLYFAIGEDDSYYGSGPAKKAYHDLRKQYQEAGLSESEIANLLVLDVKDADYFTQRGYTDQHAGSVAFAYDAGIMGWLFGNH